MRMIGGTDALMKSMREEHQCSFLLTQKTMIDRPSAPCSENPDYSFTSCIFTFIENSVGCQLDWFGSSTARDLMADCHSREQIRAYYNTMKWVYEASWIELTNVTGCQGKCKLIQYSFTNCFKEKVTWKHNWSSSVYLQAEKTMVKKEKE